MNFIIIPVSNPDGRNAHLRINGNKVNLSTNFVILSEPETRALYDTLVTWKPEVILNIHESAVLKKKSLGGQGYLIDFETQLETANSPNVDNQIHSFSSGTLLPEIITLINDNGLRAQHYIGEITDINQIITHGGLSLHNLRNIGGMMGSFSFLLENRLDPSMGTYPTPRNIRARVTKQYLSISSFLNVCRNHKTEIIKLTQGARRKWENFKYGEFLYLYFAYTTDSNQPKISMPLCKIETGDLIEHIFYYQSRVEKNYCFDYQQHI